MAIVSKIFHQNPDAHYTKYNNDFGHIAGVTCAVMLSKLTQMYETFINDLVSHQKYGSNWFYATIDNIEYQTCLTRREQETAIHKLKRMGIIEIAVFGTPAKRYFRMNEDKLNEYLGLKIELLNCRNVQNGNNNFIKSEPKANEDPQFDAKEVKKETTRLARTANWFGGNGSHGLINNTRELKKENIKEIHAPTELGACVSDSFSSPSVTLEKPIATKVHYKSNVSVTTEEHNKLVEKFGEDLVKEGYEDLSEWKESASPSIVAKHKSDYRRLRKWVIPKLQEEKHQSERIKQQNIAPHRRGSKLVTPGDLDDPSNFKLKRF